VLGDGVVTDLMRPDPPNPNRFGVYDKDPLLWHVKDASDVRGNLVRQFELCGDYLLLELVEIEGVIN